MYNTGNPVPSAALEDMADNAQTFDALVTKTEGTTTDRLGRTRRVFQQILMDMGFQPLAGSFQTGATITARNQALYDEVSQVFYAWGGIIPVGGYIVAAGSTPATSGGIGAGAWVDRTDVTLRQELLSGAMEIRNALFSLRDFVSVKDFGAVGDGVTDDTAAIQAAITSVGVVGGGSIHFPAGTYKISDQLNITYSSIRLVGSSRYSTLIKQTNLNSKTISITNNFFQLEHLSFIYDGTPVVGATALYCFGSYCTLKDFVIRNSYTAIEFDQGVAGKVTDFELLDYESVGLLAHSLNDLFVSRFIMNAGNTTRGSLGGIRLVDKVEAFICTDGDVLMGQYSMTMDAPVYGIGTRPAYNNFTNVFFDSAFHSVNINKTVETDFVNCWFSGGRSDGGRAGVIITTSQGLRFTNNRFFNCGGSGVIVESSASDITFTACKAESNSVTSGAGVAHGFGFANGCTQFQLIGCTSSNGLYPGIQGYGIFIGSGCDQFVVSGCNVVGNVTGSILDASSGAADKTVHGNIGYRTSNTGQATIMAGTTTIVVTHGLDVKPRQQDITLTRGNGNQGSTDLTVQSITSTQFTILTAAAPSGNMVVNWMARCAGA